MAGAERPEVKVVDPGRRSGLSGEALSGDGLSRRRATADLLGSGTSGGRGGWPRVAALVALLAGTAVVVQHHQARPRLSLGAATLRGDGTLTVTLVNRGSAVRVPGLELRADGLAATTPGALDQEVAVAEDLGVPPVHDATRLLAPGRHAFELGVRADCPGRSVGSAQVLVRVDSGGTRRTLTGAVPRELLSRLRCEPLSVRAGIAPTDPAAGQVSLLLTAHAGQAEGAPGFERLAWAGYHVSGVGGVVPLALGWAAADTNVVFSAVVTPDCTARATGGLTAVFAHGPLSVPVTDAAAARIRALRSACP